ncbi:MAG: threonine aldolase family protein, partial [Syntrophobacteraceae bacterium]
MAFQNVSDFRSDTVTRPTPSMYEAMMTAPLGDDSLRDDPTVSKLEQMAADLLGKEAAMLCISGTMANQVAIRTHCLPGQEVILEESNHILNYEMGSAAFAMIQTRPIVGTNGVMEPREVERRLRSADGHSPGTGLICLENTHNAAGGVVLPRDLVQELSEIARRAGIPIHLDGARIFDAQVASGIPARELAAPADSVMFCLSKGLGCPLGSLLCGSKPFIEKARSFRQVMGGGMRQAGIIAACGIVALEENIGRLSEDHKRARRLGEGLSRIPAIEIDISRVETNMVYFGLKDGCAATLEDIIENARHRDVLMAQTSKASI